MYKKTILLKLNFVISMISSSMHKKYPVKLDIYKIELCLYVHFLLEFDICKIEFFTKLDFRKMEFQKGGILLYSLRMVLFC